MELNPYESPRDAAGLIQPPRIHTPLRLNALRRLGLWCGVSSVLGMFALVAVAWAIGNNSGWRGTMDFVLIRLVMAIAAGAVFGLVAIIAGNLWDAWK